MMRETSSPDFMLIEVADRQVDDVTLDLRPELRDEVLRLDAQHAREREGGDGLHADSAHPRGRGGFCSRVVSAFPIASSMKYLVEAGRTSPQSRLIRMRRSPSRSFQRRGQMMVP